MPYSYVFALIEKTDSTDKICKFRDYFYELSFQLLLCPWKSKRYVAPVEVLEDFSMLYRDCLFISVMKAESCWRYALFIANRICLSMKWVTISGYLITEQYKQHSCFEGVFVFPLNDSGNEQIAPVLCSLCFFLVVFATAVLKAWQHCAVSRLLWFSYKGLVNASDAFIPA